jgi:hypothetical protein
MIAVASVMSWTTVLYAKSKESFVRSSIMWFQSNGHIATCSGLKLSERMIGEISVLSRAEMNLRKWMQESVVLLLQLLASAFLHSL